MLTITGLKGGHISAISGLIFFKFKFAGMHSFSKVIKTFATEATPEAPSAWPTLLFNKPIGSLSFLPTQNELYIALASCGSPALKKNFFN